MAFEEPNIQLQLTSCAELAHTGPNRGVNPLFIRQHMPSTYLERGHVGCGHDAFDLAYEANECLSHIGPNMFGCTAAAVVNWCRLS